MTSYLDALRGIAAIVVVNHHFFPYEPTWIMQQPFVRILAAGRGMVEKIGEEELDRTNFSGARSFGCGILRREALPISGDLTPAVLLHPI